MPNPLIYPPIEPEPYPEPEGEQPMSIQFIQTGDCIDYTPDANVAVGVGVIKNYLFGVTKAAINAGELGALAVDGVFNIPKSTDPGESFEQGDYVLFDDVAQLAHPLSSGGVALIGRAIADAVEADTTVQVKLLY